MEKENKQENKQLIYVLKLFPYRVALVKGQ